MAGPRRAGRVIGLAALLGAAGLFASPLLSQARSPAPAPTSAPATAAAPVWFDAEVVARYPHDSGAFTEGLIWRDGALYESVGHEGRSDVRRVRLSDGKVLQRGVIPADQFGEGLASYGSELISLTWHDGIAHRWDARTLKERGQSRYAGEGWGLASDGRRLIMSDGSTSLRFLDPRSLRPLGTLPVTLRGRPLSQVNELEVVDGAILANVWHQPVLVRIDPASGAVTGIIDLRPIVAQVAATDPEAVANGVAWDSAKRRLFITGKLWPMLFEVRLKPRTP